MLQALVNIASRLLEDARRPFLRQRVVEPESRSAGGARTFTYFPLRRVLLTGA